MADYVKKYQLNSRPTASNDGSSTVRHSITAVYRADDAIPADPWLSIPGRHKTIVVPADEMKVVMDMANGAAKVTAYKNVLASNINTGATPITGWSSVQLEAMLDANDRADEEADRADNYITLTLGLTYPVQFAI